MEGMLDNSVALMTHELAIVELRYILCRRLGKEVAWAKVEKVLGSGYIVVEDASGLMEAAASLKCERRVSLPDCFTLALADRMKIKALFASREAEIVREMENAPFRVELVFLEE
jgi:predicted nucleic acid-binding protein